MCAADIIVSHTRSHSCMQFFVNEQRCTSICTRPNFHLILTDHSSDWDLCCAGVDRVKGGSAARHPRPHLAGAPLDRPCPDAPAESCTVYFEDEASVDTCIAIKQNVSRSITMMKRASTLSL